MDWWELCVSFFCCRSYKKEDPGFSQPDTERKGPLYRYSTPLRGYGAIGSGQAPRNMATNLGSSAIEDRKLYGRRNYGYIRPPNIRRDSQAQVTLKGWLFRLEGGALRQWKRRWCVLTDYCLFYYKDLGEDKLLGSVILPSYRISPCCANDKIARRFAFKVRIYASDNVAVEQIGVVEPNV
ncbi:pleckstrin homology domain-containing family A member 4-like [Limulus polyphemus]|uniref:Pleckstrin homology domain-containing family A member 4-like n=1 Tax=Limulus polyphemus TaxID=6850 RepID=A0ABM1SRX5_LIMPO|nr:pleckstrin homology domain-containing family A member 4-like [Limulus polyphemus]